MVINHLLTGMILQVPSGKLRWQMENEPHLKMYSQLKVGNFPASYVSRFATVQKMTLGFKVTGIQPPLRILGSQNWWFGHPIPNPAKQQVVSPLFLEG